MPISILMASLLCGPSALGDDEVALRHERPGEGARIEAAREEIKAIWGSVDSLEIKSTEAHDGRSEFDEQRFEYCAVRRGWYSMEGLAYSDEATRWICDLREDGRKSYNFSHDDLGEVQVIRIDNAKSTPATYRGVMCSAIWAIMPGGKFLDQHIRDGAMLRYDEGDRAFVMTSEVEPWSIECTLDPGHDWLPGRITTRKDGAITLTLVVDKFMSFDGRWFPVEGHETSSGAAQGETRGVAVDRTFAVTSIRANFSPKLEDFQMGRPPAGTKIVDALSRKTTFEGGEGAWAKRQSEFNERREAKNRVEIVVRDEASGWPWYVILPIIVGAASLVGVLWIRLRGAR